MRTRIFLQRGHLALKASWVRNVIIPTGGNHNEQFHFGSIVVSSRFPCLNEDEKCFSLKQSGFLENSQVLIEHDSDGVGEDGVEGIERKSANLSLALVLKSGHDVAVLPADLLGDLSQLAGGTTGAEADDGEGLGNNELLLLVEGRGATLEDTELLEGDGTALALVGAHSTDGAEEHL